jgi:hypothetical protein
MASKKVDWKIFKTNRLGFTEMYNDVVNYIKNVYNANSKEFTTASPFAQIVNVIVNLGRMILFYIENSITELNIETAYQARSIRGLSELTGHIPSRGMAARGSLYMSYNMASEYEGQSIYIRNYTKIRNGVNGLTYLAVFPTNVMQITVGAHDSKIEIPIIQGEIKYQQATGTGEALQSFNFANKTDTIIDDFFVNVYVNGTRWETVKSILDMTYQQKACIIKNSINGGTDVFFGTGNNGMIPPLGSTILFEYIVTSGAAGNVSSESEENYWQFIDDGLDANNDYVNLNSIYNLSSASDIIFGSSGEAIEMTRQLAPHMSRNFVLGNAINYKTFLSKLNLFSIIDVFSGFNTAEDQKIEEAYSTAKIDYNNLKTKYAAQVNLTGMGSKEARDILEEMNAKKKELQVLRVRYEEQKMDDSVVYMYLVPDITKRLGENENYFTCDESRFVLTDDEKQGIVNLIEESGQKIMTVDNRIMDPIFVRFAINIYIQMWNEYDFNSVKSSIVSVVSDYLINNTRRDRIPVSDIIRIIECVDGVDSVMVYFDAAKTNELSYGKGKYGIDEYGDIILGREMTDIMGNTMVINDIRPLFRGNFISSSGIYYEDSLDSLLGPINITLRGRTKKQSI